MRSTSDHVLGLFGNLLRRRDASAWFHGVWTCCAKVLEYWMISSLRIKLNLSWNFWKNWNVPLVFSERSWWAGFNGIYLVRFGFRINVGDIDFKMISATENSNKFQKTRFWKEKSVEDVVTLGTTAQATLATLKVSLELRKLVYKGGKVSYVSLGGRGGQKRFIREGER